MHTELKYAIRQGPAQKRRKIASTKNEMIQKPHARGMHTVNEKPHSRHSNKGSLQEQAQHNQSKNPTTACTRNARSRGELLHRTAGNCNINDATGETR